jgi:multicomponent Na+:H+ antiporter subunit D
MSILLLFPVLLPVLAGLAVLLVPQLAEAKLRRIVTIATMALTLVLLIPVLFTGEMTLNLFTLSDNLPIFLHTDTIGLIFAVLMAFVWMTAGIYSFPYMAHEGGEKRYYTLYLCTLGALMGLCFSGSIITFYMFFEAMTLLTMPMVMHSGKKDAVAAGVKYLIYSVLGASLVLLGVFVLSPYVKDFSFQVGGALDMEKVAGHEGFVMAFGFLMLVGFSAKAGLFPLHGWLPTAHPAAPSPASAVLSGVITKAGVLGVIRLMYCYLGADFLRGSWVQTAYMCMTLLTIFTGSLLAYHEGHLKKRLAWSSVSQVSYVLFGLSTMNPVGFAGAVLHAIAHSFAKDTLFMSAGAIIMKTEKTQVADLRGIGKQMPVTMACFTVASLGLVGIPPCMGFISKWYLAQGSLAASGVNAALNVIGPVVLLISALLTAGYLFPIVIRGFITGNAGHGHGHDEPAETFTRNDAPKMMLIPLLVLAALSVLVGMFPGALIDLLSKIGTALM